LQKSVADTMHILLMLHTAPKPRCPLVSEI